MSVTDHASLLGYFFQAGLVVKTVMLILIAASILSWTLIFQRAIFYKKVKQQMQRFQQAFWSSADLTKFFLDMEQNPKTRTTGVAAIFYAGFQEFLRMHQRGGQIGLDAIRRVMQIKYAKEATALEKHLSWFASIGSIAPYLGLFGTVWGIMASLQALGQAQQATIAMVAPGISEALVATALGLFTAIPAAIALNRYTTQCNQVLDEYDVFQEEFLSLIEQQVPSKIQDASHD